MTKPLELNASNNMNNRCAEFSAKLINRRHQRNVLGTQRQHFFPFFQALNKFVAA